MASLERPRRGDSESSDEAHVRENYAAKTLDLDDDALERIDGIDRVERVVEFPDAPWNAE